MNEIRNMYLCNACGSKHNTKKQAYVCCYYNIRKVMVNGFKIIQKKGKRRY